MQYKPFYQKAPVLGNQYTDDDILGPLLKLYLSPHHLQNAHAELHCLGQRVIGREMLDACQDAETHTPFVEEYDSFGNRVSRLRTAAGWKYMKTIAAEEGIVATAYERKYAEQSRIVQFAKVYIYHPSAAMFGCPLAMTDGAARLLELAGQHHEVQRRLTSRNADMYTSGQWMTERGGGSDLTNSETIAIPAKSRYELSGFKWFSSATDADIALSLGRTEEGMSLFMIKVKDAGTTIKIARLKKKLGTHALPTAELELNNVPATIIGELGKGIKTISTILNITRLYTAVSAVSQLRRAYAIAHAYSEVRLIGKQQLLTKDLHAASLSRIYTSLTGLMHLTFYLVSLLGKEECDTSTQEERDVLRGLTPLVKAYVSKLAHTEIGECCEALGGLGYVENIDVEFNVARLFRDSLVLCIWEGTTNVLALDFARALKSQSVRASLKSRFGDAVSAIDEMKHESEYKTIMFSIAEKVTATLLNEAATTLQDSKLREIAHRWSVPTYQNEKTNHTLIAKL